MGICCLNRELDNLKSVFNISQEELKQILQSEKVVSSPVKPGKYGDYIRIVDVGKVIGHTALNFGGVETSWIKVYTDSVGNLITAFPIPRP